MECFMRSIFSFFIYLGGLLLLSFQGMATHDNGEKQFCLRGLNPTILLEEKKSLDGVAQKLRSFTQGDAKNGFDVHAFNKAVVAPVLNDLLKIEKCHIHFESSDASLGDIKTTLLKHMADQKDLYGAQDQHVFSKSFNTLITYVQKSPVEPETQMNVPQVLTTLWKLMNVLETHDPSSKGSYRALLIYSISENSLAQGGCYAGYAGRLFQNYFNSLSQVLLLSEKAMDL